ncbi:TRAP transporter small permease [Maledivibacter halophilus]|uniref:TRAP-type C4-dicarboxylate transport system, small permease component n=1 Tax=Maledivibacter halophilus TaxID=36842 RepID=A0A1T5KQX0_9FIRM|nr:TRAP transporter small permease [Maledivibacter halophilus]SKC66156.1 TRAP-type C4-dicarboxylate transport system, small permease component [Maledivibacter halophilus]
MKKAIDLLERIQKYIGIAFLSIFIVVVIIQIIARYLEISVLWTEEIAVFSFIWAVFMGASIMVRKEAHFSFDFLKSKLSGIKKHILDIIINVLMLGFTLYMLVYGKEIMITFWNYNWYSLPDFKMGYVWAVIPLTGMLMSIYIIEHIVNNIIQMRGGK